MFRKLPAFSVPPTYSESDISAVLQILAQGCLEESRISWGLLKETSKAMKYF